VLIFDCRFFVVDWGMPGAHAFGMSAADVPTSRKSGETWGTPVGRFPIFQCQSLNAKCLVPIAKWQGPRGKS
jgi:hypothetical protein